MPQDSFIHNTLDANIKKPLGENLQVFRRSNIGRVPVDPTAPFNVVHPDGYVEPIKTAALNTNSMIGQNFQAAVPANTKVVSGPYASSISALASEIDSQLVIPYNCNISDLYIIPGAAISANGPLVVTVRKNGVDTALSVTIPAGSANGVYSNIVNSIAFVAGDLISFAYDNQSNAQANLKPKISVKLS